MTNIFQKAHDLIAPEGAFCQLSYAQNEFGEHLVIGGPLDSDPKRFFDKVRAYANPDRKSLRTKSMCVVTAIYRAADTPEEALEATNKLRALIPKGFRSLENFNNYAVPADNYPTPAPMEDAPTPRPKQSVLDLLLEAAKL